MSVYDSIKPGDLIEFEISYHGAYANGIVSRIALYLGARFERYSMDRYFLIDGKIEIENSGWDSSTRIRVLSAL